MDGYGRLVVGGGGKNLTLFRRHRGVLFNQLGGHTAQCLDTKRQRSNVEQQNVLDVPLQYTTLDGGADRHYLVGIDSLVRGLAEDLFDFGLDPRHPGHSADQDDFVDFRSLESGILQCGAARTDCPVDQIFNESLKFRTAEFHVEMFRAGRIGGDERQVNIGLNGAGQCHLGLFRLFLETLQSHFIATQIDALITLEFIGQPVDDAHIEVFTAKEGITVGRFDFKYAVADFQDRNIEGTATKIENGDLFLALLIQTISQ